MSPDLPSWIDPWLPSPPPPPPLPPPENPTNPIGFSGHIYPSYQLGRESGLALMRARVTSTTNPIVAFACVASYFAGKNEIAMEKKMDEFETQHEKYMKCLDWSQYAHERKASAVAEDGGVYGSSSFKSYINGITNNKFNSMDKGNDNYHNKDEWQSFIDVINQQKDMESTDLNKLSTEMDMAVKDCSEAEQMAANAVKKATDLMSTQGRTAGG